MSAQLDYLLECAKVADHEELAYETINAKLTLEDFLEAAEELIAARRVIHIERPLSRPHCSLSCPCERNQAWLAYDRAVRP
jgi:DNA-binding MurR/RpiR family transcriptional regulator